MDIRQLRYFVGIIEYGSLGKAAEKLYVAQPSLSQQIAKLEGDLGLTLLVRSPQGVKPTAAGQALYRHARLVIRQMEQLRQEVCEGTGGESGTVAVGFPTTMTSILAVPVFERVRARYPGIRLQYVESMSGFINELLANGRLDLAILFRESNTTGIAALPLFDEALQLFGEPGGTVPRRARTCSLRALAGVPLVAPSVPNGLRLLLERTFAREEVLLDIIADIDSLPTLLSLAKSGAACTILPASAIASRDPSSRPTMRRIVDPEIRRPVSLCWSNTAPVSSAALAVRQTIVELVHELSESGAWTGITLRASEALASG
ncbi:LysR substrate-binding domain-containing protein [Trinickia soli]|uniref:LysR family transcriptional regulator n=1 Tax=Trinickia soli TaxID=380675 RepID=A0A2N7W6M9_9BURK|nr:LysR substrate-binding domain-containing protein [Trinickia soli]KAA0072650.1 LysR family transcriptional regulator [Paraburkholderia sp. T12-10]PMS25056.1 LysR family transcriptional regulator [Trinickia soli]CAB3647699.1 HTH-type transcriptional regulator GltC [Trinickia soli]